jgi:hypothetical protein
VYNKLTRINRSQRGMYTSGTTGTSPAAYYVEGNKIHTVPDAGASVTGSLRYDYIRIQNQLVQSSSCGRITLVAVVGADYQITVDSVPSYAAGVDLISGTNPFNVFARGQTAAVGGFIMTIASAAFERAPVIGDYVAPVGMTPIANIPEDLHPVLVTATVLRCLAVTGDVKNMQATAQLLAADLGRMKGRIEDRVDTAPEKIVCKSQLLNMMRG